MSANNVIKATFFDVLRFPVVTEKTHAQILDRKYTFNVSCDASKKDIKHAVEGIFNVNVVKVNSHVRAGKAKRFRGHLGKRKDVKLAVVTLTEGQSIDIEGLQ